ncbi:hypothetical protein EJB05_32503, partial [Eragrostis curvula]
MAVPSRIHAIAQKKEKEKKKWDMHRSMHDGFVLFNICIFSLEEKRRITTDSNCVVIASKGDTTARRAACEISERIRFDGAEFQRQTPMHKRAFGSGMSTCRDVKGVFDVLESKI